MTSTPPLQADAAHSSDELPRSPSIRYNPSSFAKRARARMLTLNNLGNDRLLSSDRSGLASNQSVLPLYSPSHELPSSPLARPSATYNWEDRRTRSTASELDNLSRKGSPAPSESPYFGPADGKRINGRYGAYSTDTSGPQTPGLVGTPLTSRFSSATASQSMQDYFGSTAHLLPESRSSSLPPVRQTADSAVATTKLSMGERKKVGDVLRRIVDPKFVKQVINPREIVLPMTGRKAAIWSVYAGVAAGIALADHYGNLTGHIGDGLRYNNFILMSFIYGIEPFMLLIMFGMAKYGAPASMPDESVSIEQRRWRANTRETGLIIPAHNSDPEGFAQMLRTALKTFAPQNIFVVDNANTATPVGETQAVARSVDREIQYMWMPLGNKNAAEYVGALAAKQRGLEYVLCVDDDVSVPETFVAPTHLLIGDIKAACFPIQALDKQLKKPLFVSWQDLEYKMAGMAKVSERRTCGVLYPHGAVSFWEADTLLTVLRNYHDLIFFAEDVKLGIGLMRAGKQLTIDDSQVFSTEAPETLFGPPPNFYQQRVRSWEMGRHLLYKEFVRSLFSRNGQSTVHGFAVQKMMQSYNLASNAVDWLRVPLFVAMGHDWHFWARAGAFAALPIAPALVYKYVLCRNRPDLAPSLKTSLTFPVYKQIVSAFSVIGAARSLYFYWPNRTKLMTLPEMEKAQDPRCIYLSPQFARDPGFLARGDEEKVAPVEDYLKHADLSTELSMRPLTEEGEENRREMLAEGDAQAGPVAL